MCLHIYHSIHIQIKRTEKRGEKKQSNEHTHISNYESEIF